jgi:hypothetical protein
MARSRPAVGERGVREINVAHRVAPCIILAALIHAAIDAVATQHRVWSLSGRIGSPDPGWLLTLQDSGPVSVHGMDG